MEYIKDKTINIVKDLIGGKSKEFNTLKSEDRKELLDLLEAEIKKDMDDIPFADGGRVGFASGKLARLKKKYKGSTLEAILENPKIVGTELGYEGISALMRLLGLYQSGGSVREGIASLNVKK